VHHYQGSSKQFNADTVQGRLAGHLSERFFQEFGYKPAQAEVRSWQSSLRARSKAWQL
jgi:hypothetical protein